MLKRRAFLLLGSAAAIVAAEEAKAFFIGGVGIDGLTNKLPPCIVSVVPNNGLASGGNTVTITGVSFAGITDVSFGGVAASNLVITGNDVLTCTAPPHLNGVVNVQLTNAVGASIPNTFYTYGSVPVVSSISPSSGPGAGGTPVTIGGSNFTGTTGVTIGGPATSVVVVDDGHITCTTAVGSASTVNVVVTNAVGSGTLNAAFTYQGGAFSQSIPLGSFVPQQVNGGFAQANGDGTTGYNSGNGWTVLQFGVNFPANDFYKFVVPAWCSGFTSIPANSLQVHVDQLEIPSDAGTVANRNWFVQFVSNLGTAGTIANSQNYSYTAPVTAGWHSIQIRMNNAAYYGTGALNSAIHGDRLNINSTGVGLPAEPAGNRDPGTFPMSSYHFINVPFGANATWLALSDPKARTINGSGGNGAFISINANSFTNNVWSGVATDPIWSNSSTDSLNRPSPIVNMVYPCPGDAGLYQSGGSDGGMTMYDTANPRFQYIGAVFGINGRNAPHGTFTVQDSYNLNSASPQEAFNGYGIVRIADLDSGVIAHRMVGGLATANAPSTTIGYGLGQQTAKAAGMPWPGCDSDHDWPTRYANSNGPDYASVIGIPPNIAKPAGLNAATSMLWDAFQNYGCFLNVSAGSLNSAGITVYAEGGAFNHPALASANLNLIVPNLSVMSNPAPIVVGQGFGGGAPRVPLLPGQRQGLPSLGIPPYALPASPPNVPIQVAPSAGASVGPGSASITTAAINVPVGSAVFIMLQTNSNVMPASAPWTTLTDTAGNSYTIVQPAFNGSTNGVALGYSLNITHAIVANSTKWTASQQINASFWTIPAVFYLPPPPSGTFAFRASGSAISGASVSTLSASLAGVQAGDLIISHVKTSNYSELTAPAGYGDLQNFPPTSMPFRIAATTGTATVNPTWNFSSPAAMAAAAFSLGTVSNAPLISTVNDTGTGTPNGSTAGNRPITISGSNFTGATSVTFGGTAALAFTVNNSTTITCRSPPHAAGAVSVVVTHPTNGSNGANTAYTYRIVDGTGAPLSAPSVAAAQGYNTLSFQDEFNDLLGIQINATNQGGSNYVTPSPGYNWYSQSFGWVNSIPAFNGNAMFWYNGTTNTSTGVGHQFFDPTYFSVAGSVLTMTGHVPPQPDTLSSFHSTAYSTNAPGYVGTTIKSDNGFYAECRFAGRSNGTGQPNAFWTVDNRGPAGTKTDLYIELDIPELNPSTINLDYLEWISPGNSANQNYYVNHASAGVSDDNFHIYGTLYVPPAQAGGNGFLKFYVDGSLRNTFAVTTGSQFASHFAGAQNQVILQTDSNSNSGPMHVDYVRIWQQTPTG